MGSVTFGHMLIDVAGVLPFIDWLDVLFCVSMEGQQHFAKFGSVVSFSWIRPDVL